MKLLEKVKPIPKGYHTITPFVVVSNIADALLFYKNAFGAEERMRFQLPDGQVTHAEIKIGDSIVMLGDESPEMKSFIPRNLKGISVGFYLYVEDVDAFVAHAVQNDAILDRPAGEVFWGDRMAQLQDPWGHVWTIATHTENIDEKELRKRGEEFYKQRKS